MNAQPYPPLRATDMQAWRAACEPRVQAVLNHAFDQLNAFYRLPQPDTLRPVVDGALRHALDQLFDASHYPPRGMTPPAVLARADEALVGYLETYFAPHQHRMEVPAKTNRPGSLNVGYNDVDRTMALYSPQFISAMRDALPEVGLPVPPAQRGGHVQQLAERYGERTPRTR